MTTALDTKPLTPAQVRHFQRHIVEVSRAAWEIEQAQENQRRAEAAANSFVAGFCADELGVTLGKDGWEFDQAKLCFVQMPMPDATTSPSDSGEVVPAQG